MALSPNHSMIQFLQEVSVNGFVFGKFWMESCGEHVALFHKNRKIAAAAEHSHALTHPANDGGANENQFDRVVGNFRTVTLLNRAVNLAAIGVAFHSNIH